MAPEELQQWVATFGSDVWAYGVCLWEIMTNCASDPFGHLNLNMIGIDGLRKLLVSGKESLLYHLPKDADGKDKWPTLRPILELCFTIESKERPSFELLINKVC